MHVKTRNSVRDNMEFRYKYRENKEMIYFSHLMITIKMKKCRTFTTHIKYIIMYSPATNAAKAYLTITTPV